MKKSGWIVLLAFALALVSAPAFAQGSNASSLSGVVKDKDGGVVPGATVVAKSNATGASLTTTTNSSGVFSFPTLDAGSYNVKISLQSFKTVEYKDVRLLSATPGTLQPTVLEIGAMTDMVEVRGQTDLIRTQTPTVNMTVTGEFIESLPRNDRNALSFTIFLPGVSTSGGSQNSRSSTVVGLPQNTIAITMDGISISNNLQSGDGFFALVTPRLDAVEEVTLTTAAAGADSSGQGSVQIRFVTRSGTNQFNTSLYEYWQNKVLNTNTFFNALNGLPRARRTIDIYGGRIGGPIVIPGLVDGHGKAFFFFNQEENWEPNQTARARTVARDSAVAGNFTYNSNTPQTVNLLALAAAQGNPLIPSTVNPTVAQVLAKIRAASLSTGSLQTTASTPNTQTFNYQATVSSLRHSPTTRVDINLTPHHRLSGSYYLQRYVTKPDTLNSADPTFPGFPAQASQLSYRTTGSSTLRSTFGTNIVNELLVGWQSSPVNFFTEATNAIFTDPALNTNGYFLSMGFVTSPAPGNSSVPESRNTVNWQVNDSLNWLKGDHSFKFGVEFTRLINRQDDYTVANQVSLGLSTNAANADPALAMFNSTNFPTSTTTDLANARSLYAMLTGHVSSLPGTGLLDASGTNYIFNGHQFQKERQDELGFYASDSWRVRPNVTITAGLRYEVQLPVVALVGLLTGSTSADECGMSGLGSGPGGRFCNLFSPGTIGASAFKPVWNGTTWAAASVPSFNKLSANTKGYDLDLNNFAPSVGVNWRPVVKTGFLRKLLGDPEQATITGAFARTFNRERFDRFQTVYVGNPGATTPGGRGFGSTNFLLNPLDQPCITASLQPGFVVGQVVNGSACDPSKLNSNPLLFSQTSLIGPGDPLGSSGSGPGFLNLTLPNGTPYTKLASGVFPLKATTGDGIFVFDPKIQVPYTDSWTAGLQRSVGRDMAIEFRYIGNINQKPWTSENWNGANYRETGLLGPNMLAPNDATQADQFTKAMANLQANVRANRGPSFAYFGAGTGTSPLPLFLTHLQPGRTIADALDPTLYTGTQWTSATFTNNLNPFNPSPQGIANTLSGTTAFLQNAIDTNSTSGAAGIYPANFWRMNPSVSAANVTRNLGSSKYNSLQVDLRRRFSKGFQADFSYTYARGTAYNNVDLHRDLLQQRGTNIPHAIKMLWVWDLPVGRGRRFGTNMNTVTNAILGGWQFSGTGRIQVPLFRLQNTLIVGMDRATANKLLKTIIIVRDSTTGSTTVRDMPQDVIDNTIKAYSGSATNAFWYPVTPAVFGPATNFGQTPGALITPATQQVPTGRFFAPAVRPAGALGPNDAGCFGLFSGDCAPDLFFYGKWFGEYDMKFLKKFQLPHKVQFEMDVEIFNALNAINFNGNLNPGSGATIFQIGSQGSQALAGAGRTGQLVWRVTW